MMRNRPEMRPVKNGQCNKKKRNNKKRASNYLALVKYYRAELLI